MSESNTKYIVIGIIVVILCLLSSVGAGVGWYYFASAVGNEPPSTTSTTSTTTPPKTDTKTDTNTTKDTKTDTNTTKDPTKDVQPAGTTKSTPEIIDCVMSEWSKCDKECGGGKQTRTIVTPAKGGKACGDLTQVCNTQVCPASVGQECGAGCASNAWCNKTKKKCYETCVSKGTCANGNAIPRKDTYFCDYSGCGV